MRKFVLIIGLLCVSQIFSQHNIPENEKAIAEDLLSHSLKEGYAEAPLGMIIHEFGDSFIGVDYEAGTLDKNDEEQLVVHLSGLDCYTLVDNTIAISRAIRFGESRFDAYLKELENIRYRDGKLDGYISRLHYVTDWIYDLSKRGILRDVTSEIGGVPYKKTINFMSENADKYTQLKGNEENIARIKSIEEAINFRHYFYIPQSEIASMEDKINNGDIIALTTSIKGLDIVHVGIAVRLIDNRIHLLHAPNVGYKVQHTKKPLADYVTGNKSQTGIMVFRAAE